MKLKFKNQEGIALLLAVIIISAAALMIATTVLVSSLDKSKASLHNEKTTEIFNGTDGCVEEALIALNNDPGYTGENLTIENVSCTITVSGTGDDRTINVVSTQDTIYSREVEVEVDMSGDFEITSWREITN